MLVDKTSEILLLAQAHGFSIVGVAAVEAMDPAPLQRWLQAGYGAEMEYLNRHLPLRANLREVMPGACSVICVALPYAGSRSDEGRFTVAKYARGADYHAVMRARLSALWQEVVSTNIGAEGRIFVDSGPLPERELARRAGIGWVGEHSCLINPDFGSRFCLGEILTTLTLRPTSPIAGGCGDCHDCRSACPTGALLAPAIVDARRCLSYLTIEYRGPIPRELRPLLGARLFGCDTCQDVCPYNRNTAKIATLLPANEDLLALNPYELLRLSPIEFNYRFRNTALARAKRRGVLRNACVVLGNLHDSVAVSALCEILYDAEALLRGHAAWALGQIGGARDNLQAALDVEENSWVREEITLALQIMA